MIIGKLLEFDSLFLRYYMHESEIQKYRQLYDTWGLQLTIIFRKSGDNLLSYLADTCCKLVVELFCFRQNF